MLIPNQSPPLLRTSQAGTPYTARIVSLGLKYDGTWKMNSRWSKNGVQDDTSLHGTAKNLKLNKKYTPSEEEEKTCIKKMHARAVQDENRLSGCKKINAGVHNSNDPVAHILVQGCPSNHGIKGAHIYVGDECTYKGVRSW